MRKIKFRAWSVKQKQMLDPEHLTVVFWKGYYSVRLPDIMYFDKYIYERNPDPVLMQYTGLKDKNGKEIYEGDILRAKKYTLKRNKAGSNYKTVVWRHAHGGTGFNISFKISNVYELIGNIYENPELVK